MKYANSALQKYYAIYTYTSWYKNQSSSQTIDKLPKIYLDWRNTLAKVSQFFVTDISSVSNLQYKNSLFHKCSKHRLVMRSPTLQAQLD